MQKVLGMNPEGMSTDTLADALIDESLAFGREVIAPLDVDLAADLQARCAGWSESDLEFWGRSAGGVCWRVRLEYV